MRADEIKAAVERRLVVCRKRGERLIQLHRRGIAGESSSIVQRTLGCELHHRHPVPLRTCLR